MCVGGEEEFGGGDCWSTAPRGTCFLCALVHLPIFSNGAQQGGMNRAGSGNTAMKLHRGSFACMGHCSHK